MKKVFTNYMWAVMLTLLVTEGLLLNVFNNNIGIISKELAYISASMYPLLLLSCVLYVLVYIVLALFKVPTPRLLAKAHVILVTLSFIGFYPFQSFHTLLVPMAAATSIASLGMFLGLVVLAIRRKVRE